MVYLFIAYAITLTVILGYVISLVRRREHVRREVEALLAVGEEQSTANRNQ